MVSRNVNLYSHYDKQCGDSFKRQNIHIQKESRDSAYKFCASREP